MIKNITTFLFRTLTCVLLLSFFGCKAPNSSVVLTESPFETIILEFTVDTTPRTKAYNFTLSESGWYAVTYYWNIDGPYPDPSIGVPLDLVGRVEVLSDKNEILLTTNLDLPSISAANGRGILTFKSKDLGLHSDLTLKIKNVHLTEINYQRSGTLTLRLFKTGIDRI